MAEPLQAEPLHGLPVPPEMTRAILLRVGAKALLRARYVCREWKEICNDKELWEKIQICRDSPHEHRDVLCTQLRKAIRQSDGGCRVFTMRNIGTGGHIIRLLTSICRNVQVFQIERVPAVGCALLACIPRLTEVQLMEVTRCNFHTEGILNRLCQLCTKLTTFKVNYCNTNRDANDCDMTALRISRMQQLVHLELKGNNLTNVGLCCLFNNLHNLKFLDVSDCPYVGELCPGFPGWNVLRAKIPTVKF